MCNLIEIETLTLEPTIILYNTYKQSLLQYGIVFWDNSVKRNKINEIRTQCCRPKFLLLKTTAFSLFIFEKQSVFA